MTDQTRTTGQLRKAKLKALSRLKPYRRNANTHPPEQITALGESMKRFGFTNPILVAGDQIIAGHGRYLAARQIGLEKVPVIDLSDLSEDERRAYVIADNQLAKGSTWDVKVLGLELAELNDDGFELPLLGFDGNELAKLLGDSVDDAELAALLGEDDEPTAPEGDVRYGAMTSIGRGSVPWKHWAEAGLLEGEDVNTVIDFGCGRENNGGARYDPFTAPDTTALLRRYDRVVCSYVLNVQPSDHLVTMIAAVLRSICQPDGLVLVACRNDLDEGLTESPRGVQVGKSWSAWAALLRDFFDVEAAESRDFHGFICKPKGGK